MLLFLGTCFPAAFPRRVGLEFPIAPDAEPSGALMNGPQASARAWVAWRPRRRQVRVFSEVALALAGVIWGANFVLVKLALGTRRLCTIWASLYRGRGSPAPL